MEEVKELQTEHHQEQSPSIDIDEIEHNHKTFVICIVGAPGTGKTSTLHCMLGKPIECIAPTHVDFYQKIKIRLTSDEEEKEEFELVIVDTGGDPFASQMRMNLFEKIQPDGFMIFFAIDDRVSFDNVSAWQAEIQTVNDEAPILLVASKSDLRG